MIKRGVLVLIIVGMTQAAFSETMVTNPLLACDNELYRMNITSSKVTSEPVASLPDVAAFSHRIPTSDEEIEIDNRCVIQSSYLHAMNSSGGLIIAFDRELVKLHHGTDKVTAIGSAARILSVAAGGDRVVIVICNGQETRLQSVTEDGLVPIAATVPGGGSIRDVALSFDGSTIAVATDDNQVHVGDFGAQLEFRQTVQGSDVLFMARHLLVKDKISQSWEVIDVDSWHPTGSVVLSPNVTISPDRTLLFAWENFVINVSNKLQWLRPIPKNQYVVEAAISRDNSKLFVLSAEKPEYAKSEGPMLFLRCFDLKCENGDGRLIWKAPDKAGLGLGVWATY